MRAVSVAIADVAPTTRTLIGGSGGMHPPPERGGELGVLVGTEPIELREEGPEALRAHACVLGRIDGAARLANDRVEIVQQGEGPVPTDGEVHGQGRALAGEGE